MIKYRPGIIHRLGITDNSIIAKIAVVGAVAIGAAACSSSTAPSATAKVPTTTSAASHHKKGLIG
ncbi:MAG: hypothetical protein M1456_04085, partial [Actinobacteria bacterium]|nr:hypothetical protein [Actinomycetota bacterium]